MRTTVTLDEDVVIRLRQVAHERGISFKEAINSAVRAGLASARQQPERFVQKTYPLGIPDAHIVKATQLAGELEDEEIIRKMRLGK